MEYIYCIIAPIMALLVTMLVFPKVLRFAKNHHLEDSPNARKLQKRPIPVLGGVAVYMGVLMGLLVLVSFKPDPVVLLALIVITIMQVIGVWDDISDLSKWFRFVFEFILVGAMIGLSGIFIDDFHGLWGIDQIDLVLAIILSVILGVGIINAVNMIDGVDGYVSGYCMQTCICFALLFWVSGELVMACMALVVLASLLPFFFHNVFGIRSKMFIGDGGTMMLGILITIFVFYSLSSKSQCDILTNHRVGLVALVLAVLCIPIFDTLRVMTLRIVSGYSPFQSDKTHLHHLFIEMGFSHLGAALSILLVNFLVVLEWFVLWYLGASIEMQTYAIVLTGMVVTFGFYKFMKIHQNGGGHDEHGHPLGTKLWHSVCKIGQKSHYEKDKLWRLISWLVDRHGRN